MFFLVGALAAAGLAAYFLFKEKSEAKKRANELTEAKQKLAEAVADYEMIYDDRERVSAESAMRRTAIEAARSKLGCAKESSLEECVGTYVAENVDQSFVREKIKCPSEVAFDDCLFYAQYSPKQKGSCPFGRQHISDASLCVIPNAAFRFVDKVGDAASEEEALASLGGNADVRAVVQNGANFQLMKLDEDGRFDFDAVFPAGAVPDSRAPSIVYDPKKVEGKLRRIIYKNAEGNDVLRIEDSDLNVDNARFITSDNE